MPVLGVWKLKTLSKKMDDPFCLFESNMIVV